MPKNFLFGSLLLFSLQNSLAISLEHFQVGKLHLDVQESIHSHVLQDIAYETYIDLFDAQATFKDILPLTENLDVTSKNADDIRKHLILIYRPSKTEWVRVNHETFHLNNAEAQIIHEKEIASSFSDLYHFKLKIIKGSPIAPLERNFEESNSLVPHLEKLSYFCQFKEESNIALILTKLISTSHSTSTFTSNPKVAFIHAIENEKNDLDPQPSVMEQLKPFEKIKTKQYEHTPPMLHDLFVIYSPNTEEPIAVPSTHTNSEVQISLHALKREPLSQKLPFFPVILFDEQIDDIHSIEPKEIDKAPRIEVLSKIDLSDQNIKPSELAAYFNIKNLAQDISPKSHPLSNPDVPSNYAMTLHPKALPKTVPTFSKDTLQKENVRPSISQLKLNPPKHASEASALSNLDVELNLIPLNEKRDLPIFTAKEINPKNEKIGTLEFSNLQLLQALKFLNPHKSQKRYFSLETLKMNKPILVTNQQTRERANLAPIACVNLESEPSMLSLPSVSELAPIAFDEPMLAYIEPIKADTEFERRLHFFHQEKYTELHTDQALSLLQAEAIAANFTAPAKIDFYQSLDDENPIEKLHIPTQNNPLHTLSFVHKVRKPSTPRAYPIDFAKPYTYQFKLSEEPHKKDLIHSVQMWKTNLPSYQGHLADYIDLLAQNEEIYTPHLTNLIAHPPVDVRPLIALGQEINRQRRQMFDQLTFVPTLFELSTQVLSTEFKTDVEVIAKPNAKGYYFALKISPFFPEELKRIKQNIYFVIDGSRTITKERIKAFKKSILRAMPYLSPDDAYNIICFDKGFEKFSSINCYYSKENYEKTKRFLDNISESSLSPPQDYSKVLTYITEQFETDPSEMNVVILMTDGAAYKAHHLQHEKVMNFTRVNHNKFIVYTVTSSQNNYLSGLDLVSFLNKGEMLHSNTHAALPRQVALLVKKLRYPIATDLHLTTLSSSTDRLKFYPGSNYFENLYGHKPLVIYGEADSLGEFEFMLQGKCDDEWINITQSVNLMQALPGDRELLRDATQMEVKSKHYIYKEVQ